MRPTVFGALLSILASVPALAEAPGAEADPRPGAGSTGDVIYVMVLGSDHFEGSATDVINVEVDNVLTDRRQKELAELSTALATFKPTVVVTERVTEAPDYLDPQFTDFSPELLKTDANERVQLAFRLAAEASVTRVHGLDEQPSEGEPDYFPFGRLMAHAEAIGKGPQLQEHIAQSRRMVEKYSAESADLHIAERLLRLNNGPLSSPDFYYALADLDEGETQPAAELQAYWFMRNAKIWSKLIDVTEPGDRVVVVFGAGHKFWLEHFVEHTAGFTSVDPTPYLEKAAGGR
ncbi:MAG: DUF5694 domain-containing protein [Acidobacteriota bacterium]